MTPSDPKDGIEITPEMIERAVAFLRDFYPAEWGGRDAISPYQAECVARGVLNSVFGDASENA
jgi:hypothetical protein